MQRGGLSTTINSVEYRPIIISVEYFPQSIRWSIDQSIRTSIDLSIRSDIDHSIQRNIDQTIWSNSQPKHLLCFDVEMATLTDLSLSCAHVVKRDETKSHFMKRDEHVGSLCSNYIKLHTFVLVRRPCYLRGAIVIRTHRGHKNPYIPLFLPTILGPHYYVPPC